jgi:benzoyl-CoA reductase subunit BamC
VKSRKKTKIVKEIKVDVDKCTGCRTCEMACSAFHAVPKFSSSNPARSRIIVVMDEIRDVYVPIRAGDYTQAECNGRNTYMIDGKEYSECAFCPASCPSRDYFKEPDSGLPLKCDMCEGEEEPYCVQVCQPGALTFIAREEAVSEEEDIQVKRGEMEMGIESLIRRYGEKSVKEALAKATKQK